MSEYHLQRVAPCPPYWPRGAWWAYQITGDQIVDRVVRSEMVRLANSPAFYRGLVIARHSWCGYLGMFETLAEAMAAIEEAEGEV